MDENKKMKVWIVILSCLLVLLGAYVFYLEYDKVSDNKVDNSNNTEIEKEETNDVSDNNVAILSSEEVKNLVSQYTELGNSFNENTLKFYFGLNTEGTIVNYNFENVKLALAISKSGGSKINDCSKLASEDIVLDGEEYTLKNSGFYCFDNGASKEYNYDAVNLQYKYLFGKDTEAPKKSCGMNKYYYFKDNQYITFLQHDDSLWPDGQISNITDFKQNNKSLIVTISYLHDSEYEVYPADELNDEDINNLFKNRNDYSYQFEMDFEYEEDHFILTNITKVL